jgi:hypothetical protein
MSGAWWASTPRYPSLPGATIETTSFSNNGRSGVMTLSV